ncbi:putative Stage II sporulation protein [Candidatus Desulfosporosinus infrequens]|uniref:Putative Stage II sporulation protein n=1 Tax=Candidatus Desulfosporosinus infrequens TaxID=2043169 RepID=A0A2U3LQS4_9FIRM|nr:putative Stage II sporulation protein [Candidatus Desulfosporosinus infrequens]
MKKYIVCVISALLMLINVLPSYANNITSTDVSSSAIENVIQNEVIAENGHNWSSLEDCWTKDQKNLLASFLGNTDNEQKTVGLFNIKSAKISEIKEIPLTSAQKFSDVNNLQEEYGNVKVFYVGIDYKVKSESKYYYNGVNYRLIDMVPENNQWKMAEMADVSVNDFAAENIGFGSASEKIAARIDQARNKGLFIDPSGNVIERIPTDISSKNTLSSDTSAVIDDHYPPTSIEIYCYNSNNYEYYGLNSPGVCNVDFVFYQECVLPNEWVVSTSPQEDLNAGAMCVKMFGWYYVYYPKFGNLNADLTDQSTNSQNFIAGQTNSTANGAVADMSSYGLQESNSAEIFPTYYRAGSEGYHSGYVSQDGSATLANEGYDSLQILQYYYNDSPTTNNEEVDLFGIG